MSFLLKSTEIWAQLDVWLLRKVCVGGGGWHSRTESLQVLLTFDFWLGLGRGLWQYLSSWVSVSDGHWIHCSSDFAWKSWKLYFNHSYRMHSFKLSEPVNEWPLCEKHEEARSCNNQPEHPQHTEPINTILLFNMILLKRENMTKTIWSSKTYNQQIFQRIFIFRHL